MKTLIQAESNLPAGHVGNYVQFVKHVENTLGIVLEGEGPKWKVVALEAGKLKAALRQQRFKGVTLAHLLIAVEYLRVHKIEVRTPSGVAYYVKKALEEANTVEQVTPEMVTSALRVEMACEDGEEWVEKLSRARGEGIVDAYNEWRQARG